jgi:hypothetical protein
MDEMFVAKLIGRLGIARESMELSETPIGNQLLEIVGGLAERVRELEGEVSVVRMAGQSRVEGVTDRANARIFALEEESARLRKALSDILASDGSDGDYDAGALLAARSEARALLG